MRIVLLAMVIAITQPTFADCPACEGANGDFYTDQNAFRMFIGQFAPVSELYIETLIQSGTKSWGGLTIQPAANGAIAVLSTDAIVNDVRLETGKDSFFSGRAWYRRTHDPRTGTTFEDACSKQIDSHYSPALEISLCLSRSSQDEQGVFDFRMTVMSGPKDRPATYHSYSGQVKRN